MVVGRSLQSVMEKVVGDAMSHAGRQKAFCVFLGRLFLSACRSGQQDYCTAVGKVVRHFLNLWSHCQNERELMGLAKAECLAALCECVGPTLDASSRETLDEYFNGAIRNNILSPQLARPAKEVLLELYVKRSHWGETLPTATPTNQTPVPHFSTEAPPLTENIVQPNPVAPLRYNGTLPQQSVSIPYQSNSHSAFVQVSPVQAVVPVQAEAPPPSQYAEVERMLQSLECGELLGMFKTAMIRDNVLRYDTEVVRGALKEAGIPAGAVLSIIGYLANKRWPLTSSSQQGVLSPSTPLPHTPIFSPPFQRSFSYPQSPAGSFHGYQPQSPPSQPPGTNYPPGSSQHPTATATAAAAATGVFGPPYAMNGAQSYHVAPPAGVIPSFPPPLSSQTPAVQTMMNQSSTLSGSSSSSSISYSLPRNDPKPVGMALPGSASSGVSCDPQQQPATVRRGGFGTFRCIICRTSDHTTDMCPDRGEKFFLH